MLDMKKELLALTLEAQEEMVHEAMQIEGYSEQLKKLGAACTGGIMAFSATKKPTRSEVFEMSKIRKLLIA